MRTVFAYISSYRRYWPGSESNSTYLFDEYVLVVVVLEKYHRHECPGTSLGTALKILERMSKSANKVFQI